MLYTDSTGNYFKSETIFAPYALLIRVADGVTVPAYKSAGVWFLNSESPLTKAVEGPYKAHGSRVYYKGADRPCVTVETYSSLGGPEMGAVDPDLRYPSLYGRLAVETADRLNEQFFEDLNGPC